MAFDSYFHNKIESMKLEIIQGQAVLRRLEAQRNDYNSRGEFRLLKHVLVLVADYASPPSARGTGIITTARVLCWGSREGNGHQEGPGQGAPRGQIR